MSARTQSNNSAAKAVKTERFLCVNLGEEQYAIPILKVSEIQAYSAPAPMPRLPAHVRGVANLRGAIVPIVDLRLRLGMPPVPDGPTTVVVFLTVEKRTMGVVVEAATRVMDIPVDQIGAPPNMGREMDTSFVSGLVRSDRGMLILLDTSGLLGVGDDEAPVEGQVHSAA